MAVSISLETSAGRVMSDRWPAFTVLIVAFARVDIRCCWSAGMTWSSRPIRDHEGIAFHAGGPDISTAWLEKAGRCVAAISAVVSGSTPFAKHSAMPGYGGFGAIWR